MRSWIGGFRMIGIVLTVLAVAAFVVPVYTSLPGTIMYAGIFLLTGGILSLIGHRMKATDGRKERILREGIRGTARILSWWIVGKSGGSLDMVERCGFDFEVTVEGREPYQVQLKQNLPFSAYTRLSIGMILPVRVDPKDPAIVVLVSE